MLLGLFCSDGYRELACTIPKFNLTTIKDIFLCVLSFLSVDFLLFGYDVKFRYLLYRLSLLYKGYSTP